MIVTVARYQAITGDTSTAASAVSARIEDATDLLENELDRPLRQAERTERMFMDREGRLYPRALPIVSADPYRIDGATLWSGWPTPLPDLVSGNVDFLDVTYTGGYVERSANPTADNRLPACVERDIAWAAYRLGQTTAARVLSAAPVGASSVSLGDASVSGELEGGTAVCWSRETLRLRRRRVGIGVRSPW